MSASAANMPRSPRGRDGAALQLGETGKKLGAVENQKPQAAAEAQKDAIAPAEVRKRMRAWAKVAETILANLDESAAPAAKAKQTPEG